MRTGQLFTMSAALILAGGCVPDSPDRTEILWDTWGVPHVYAPTPDSLFYAFGWAQMESHGDLILELYGEARGRAAEYWGPEGLDLDRWLRTMGVPHLASQWYEDQSEEGRLLLDAFVEGMNAYAAAHPGRLSDRVVRVLPVQPTDVLAHTLRVIHFTFVVNAGVVGPARRHISDPAVAGGSNAWAIGPSRTADGNTILVANPHLPWQDFFLFYEAHLVGPGLDVYGTSLVGFPVPAIAFNDYLGWTHTVNTFDGADTYELTLSGDGYLFDGEVRPFETDTQSVFVRTSMDTMHEEELIVRRSVHGPVIAQSDNRAVALRVVGLDQPNMIDQYWDMIRAQNLGEFEAAVSQLQMPMFTIMYADRDGHIMHVFGGRTPRRAEGDWRFWSGFVPGDASATLWTETHSYDELPRVVDPESGWLQNANDPPWTTTFPAAIDADDYPAYMAPRRMALRPQRSARMLVEDDEVTFDEVVAYKLSTRMEMADRILDELVEAARAAGGDNLDHAARILTSWDRTADVDSRGAVLFTAWAREMGRRIPYDSPWSEDRPRATPSGLADADLAVRALERAYAAVGEGYGAADVAYGDVYRFRYNGRDMPGNGGSGGLGIFRVVNFREDADGRYASFGGDSFVAVVEFSNPIRAAVSTSYGNATQPHSPHVGDQLELMSRKQLREAWRSRRDIEANLESRTVFEH